MASECVKTCRQISPPQEVKKRNPLDILAEKCKDLPIPTDGVIAQVKRLAVSLSCRGIDSVNDEVKGEIEKIVAGVYPGKDASATPDSSTAEDKGSELKSLDTSAESDTVPFEIEKWFSRLSLHGEQSFAEAATSEGEKKVDEKSSSHDSGGKLSCDSQWLIETFGKPLKMAMSEIVAKKPCDPVSYLGFWLLDYRQREEDLLKKLQAEEELLRLRSPLKAPSLVQMDERVSEEVEEGGGQRDWNYHQYQTQDWMTFI